PKVFSAWKFYFIYFFAISRYVERVIIPYVEKPRDELDLPIRQRALTIFDVMNFYNCLLEDLKF
ncbi:hypothetical protein, partial [Acinetobacter baumannii]|uniref:hypothetical protein n=1 Tax=Acinetobacter baumannii TaxID=470 RepID=UPI00197AB204